MVEGMHLETFKKRILKFLAQANRLVWEAQSIGSSRIFVFQRLLRINRLILSVNRLAHEKFPVFQNIKFSQSIGGVCQSIGS